MTSSPMASLDGQRQEQLRKREANHDHSRRHRRPALPQGILYKNYLAMGSKVISMPPCIIFSFVILHTEKTGWHEYTPPPSSKTTPDAKKMLSSAPTLVYSSTFNVRASVAGYTTATHSAATNGWPVYQGCSVAKIAWVAPP